MFTNMKLYCLRPASNDNGVTMRSAAISSSIRSQGSYFSSTTAGIPRTSAMDRMDKFHENKTSGTK